MAKFLEASGKADSMVNRVHKCTLCVDELPQAPKPIFIFNAKAKINIISQAPGRLAHNSGIAWDDHSGARLRSWMGISDKVFYANVNVIPMSFCFPGYKNNADAPPLKRCAPQWHEQLLSATNASISVYVGRYAQQYYLAQYKSLTSAIADWRVLTPTQQIVLPHPSGRNNRWLAKHAWFETEVLPELKRLVQDSL